ncbi:MAG TPA: MipA/OmpV family protein [Xanthobacteraceae bacterium]|jgi:outer membrane protein|nr:MipA/OmpV family protein [Xanthobacteraceae bacterium]
MRQLWLGLGVAALSSGIALAADVAAPRPDQIQTQAPPARPFDIILEIGGGAAMRPAYEGAKDFKYNPIGLFTLHYLWLPGYGNVKTERDRAREGFIFAPSVRYIYKRDTDDHPELRGLNDVSASYEVGGKFGYQWNIFQPWVAVRYGFGGYQGVVGETGLAMRFLPGPYTEFTFGPRASFATSDYMRTYFGVTPAEAAASGFAAYNPSGGFKGVGLEATGRYEFTPQWSLVGALIYEKLIGDAADSPVVQVGNENQFTARLGISYRFGLKLFKD